MSLRRARRGGVFRGRAQAMQMRLRLLLLLQIMMHEGEDVCERVSVERRKRRTI